MSVVLALMGRNLRLYFRDRMGVFFSLLAALILFLLYTLFLGDLQSQALEASFPGVDDGVVKTFVDSWMFAGIVSITAVTTGLGALSVFVEDSATRRFRDFLVSPVRPGELILGYLLSAFVIAVVMTMVVLVLSVGYLFLVDGVVLTVPQVLTTLGYLTLSCIAFAALSAVVASFLRTQGAFSAVSTIVGTVLGFLAGAYIPVGSLPEAVKNVINALPFGQASMLVRQQFTEASLTALTSSEEAARSLREFYGITAEVGEFEVTVTYVLLAMTVLTVVFTMLAALRFRQRVR